MRSVDDNDCIAKTLSGDVNAFSFIVGKYRNMVYTIVHKVIKAVEDAEDVSQDVFVKAFKSLSSYKFESKFSTWLYSIAYHEAISFSRKNKQFFTPIENINENELDENVDDPDLVYSDEMIIRLKKELSLLNADEALLLSLYYNMNNSVEEISQILNISVSNVKIKLFRTRKKLLSKLNKNDNE
ncbi:MAG: sigma-70 family RNA polymerase sigma factor [Bacteroidales bacterium]|jgi:RNA polymerase sigma-70 factor (ECF subfamily)|nr:sigma-70 family RNA polymerase sigma factor [Bacteroidales bacterium]